MNDDHDDAQLDAAIEALARQEPPADHVARVLARTGPDAAMAGSASRPYQRSRPSRLIWALPVAATVLVALGVTWQVGRMSEGALERVEMARSRATSGVEGASGPYQPQVWGAPREIDLPVLPPQAYWGMDAFEEWKSLRPGATLGESGVGSREQDTGHRGGRGGARVGAGAVGAAAHRTGHDRGGAHRARAARAARAHHR